MCDNILCWNKMRLTSLVRLGSEEVEKKFCFGGMLAYRWMDDNIKSSWNSDRKQWFIWFQRDQTGGREKLNGGTGSWTL